MTFSQKFKKEIENKNMTPYECAKRSNLSISTIYKITKKNTCPNIYTVNCLAEVLGMTMSELLKDVDEF